jgi:hypothetical protein
MSKIKILISLAIFFISLNNYSQITTTKIEKKESIKEKKTYDGISDFEIFEDVEDYKQYIGQKIYTTKSYSPIYTSNGEYCTDYYSKYFTILNVIEKLVRTSQGNEMTVSDVFELKSEENGELYYYSLSRIKDKSLILVPFFTNQKKIYENKTFYIVEMYNGFIDEATGNQIRNNEELFGGGWKCEVTVLEEDSKLYYLMKNNSGFIIKYENIEEHIATKFTNISNLFGLAFMTVENYKSEKDRIETEKQSRISIKNNDAKKLILKYGKIKGELISKHKVEIGMTKEMCIDSWGKPFNIDVVKTKGKTKETFIYYTSDRKLYFENNVLIKVKY